jgi:hypothetical protein
MSLISTCITTYIAPVYNLTTKFKHQSTHERFYLDKQAAPLPMNPLACLDWFAPQPASPPSRLLQFSLLLAVLELESCFPSTSSDPKRATSFPACSAGHLERRPPFLIRSHPLHPHSLNSSLQHETDAWKVNHTQQLLPPRQHQRQAHTSIHPQEPPLQSCSVAHLVYRTAPNPHCKTYPISQIPKQNEKCRKI